MVVGFFVMAFDIDELRQSRRQAEAASTAKTEFLARMSHEIRTPLTAIVGMTELMKLEPLNDGQQQRLNRIDQAASHLLGLVNEILDVSRIESGRMQIEEVPLDIQGIVSQVVAITAESARRKGLSLELDVALMPQGLTGDPMRLQQVLLNFVWNAVKFTTQGGIVIRVQAEGPPVDDRITLRFTVEDTGVGIDPEAIPRLFQSFEQVDGSITRTYGGSGMGLFIVKQLAQLMGGDAGADSTPGHGSKFWFTACLKQQAQSHDAWPTPPNAEQDQGSQATRARVLVVDDQETNREVIIGMLEAVGIQAEQAASGEQAIERCRRNRFELILMDLHMPRLDGFATTRQILSQEGNAEVAIVAVSGEASSETLGHCLAAGMRGVVHKPYSMATLLTEVRKHLPQQSTSTGIDADAPPSQTELPLAPI